MNFISSRIHALADYLFSIVFFASPWIFDYKEEDTAQALAISFGLGIGIMSMFTRYEGGLIPVIAYRLHLLIDILTGIFLIIAPWLFGFGHMPTVLFLVFGGTALFVTFFSNTKTGEPRNPNRVIP